MTVYGERRKKVLALAKGAPAIAMTGANMFYLTDFWGGGAALVEADKTVVITSPLEKERAEALGHEVEVVPVKGWADVSKEVEKRTKGRPALADDNMGLKGRFKRDPELFLKARRVKDSIEIERITKASNGLDQIFRMLEVFIAPGKTEWEVAAEVMKVATLNGLTPAGGDSALSPTIVASGPNGALPHSELGGRKIKRGDFVVADVYFRYNGYNSDETRTFSVGTPSKEMTNNYEAVLEAQQAALSKIAPGTPCMDVHNAAVAVLKKHRVDKYLNHSIGHGVGIDIHEYPQVNRVNKDRLLVNDVITDEPGVYFKGKYGIRIEDTVQTARKPVVLTKYTKKLVVCG